MPITRAQLAKELEPGLNALFGLEYDRYDLEHAEIFDEETSDRAFEEEVMLSVLVLLLLNQKAAQSRSMTRRKHILHDIRTRQSRLLFRSLRKQ